MPALNLHPTLPKPPVGLSFDQIGKPPAVDERQLFTDYVVDCTHLIDPKRVVQFSLSGVESWFMLVQLYKAFAIAGNDGLDRQATEAIADKLADCVAETPALREVALRLWEKAHNVENGRVGHITARNQEGST